MNKGDENTLYKHTNNKDSKLKNEKTWINQSEFTGRSIEKDRKNSPTLPLSLYMYNVH